MIFQRVLKGIVAGGARVPGMTDETAQRAVDGDGIVCNWWRGRRGITPAQIQEQLTDAALDAHLVDYDTVGSRTPFISTTAGTTQVDAVRGMNLPFPPLFTALRFATDDFTRDGYVVHAYVYVLGRKSVELPEFAEEVRDVNLYTAYFPWQHEGEVVAKIEIPAVRIERIDKHHVHDLRHGVVRPVDSFTNADVYRDPFRYANVRGFPELP